MRFDLTDLRLFACVAQAASITRGARSANLALASASARLRGMEDALGTPLLERGPRGVRLTPAGRALERHARVVLQQIETMRGELRDHARGLKGHVHLLSNTAAMTEFLPRSLAGFLAGNPGVEIDLEERPSRSIAPEVASGRADAGVASAAADLGELQTFPYRTDRLVLVAPRGHALAGRRRIAFRDALEHDFVGLAEGSALQKHLLEHAARAGRRLALRVRLSSFDAICCMVERGVGLAVIPEVAAQRCAATMALRILRLSDEWALRRLVVCVRRLDDLTPHARLLVQHLALPGAIGEPSA